ncbi:putative ubiquitin thioesterase [Smittium culicis]|uniref:Putative ubiquitin thioesterase n=1 Tax=Smittium culicis TaxID=133412 RepID=A0A1R1YBI1_9FUNG|nr:putative ubiquitin thioesterase [Smittium culicis]
MFENRKSDDKPLLQFSEQDKTDNSWSLQNELSSLPEYSKAERSHLQSGSYANGHNFYSPPNVLYPEISQKPQQTPYYTENEIVQSKDIYHPKPTLPELPQRINLPTQPPQLPPKPRMHSQDSDSNLLPSYSDSTNTHSGDTNQQTSSTSKSSYPEEKSGVVNRPDNDIIKATMLIIPQQTSTSDTCTTEKEEEIVMLVSERDLIVLGWIHAGSFSVD